MTDKSSDIEPGTVVLYHAYGLQYVYHQVIFSMLTLYHHLQGNFQKIQVVVYTDAPERFQTHKNDFPLSIERLSTEQIRQYKGELGFVHRVKLCIIKDCLARYKKDIFYLDSDTYFTESPRSLLQKISVDTSIMNADDYDLLSADSLFKNDDWLLIRDAIENYTYTVEGKGIAIPLTTRMWNAGVIGISLKNQYLVDKILHLTDQIYLNRQVFTAEQFAASYYLQKKTRIVSSGNVIFHYWQYFEPFNYRSKYNYQFDLFFKRHSNTSVCYQAKSAFQLTKRHEYLPLPNQPLPEKLYKRIRYFSSRILAKF